MHSGLSRMCAMLTAVLCDASTDVLSVYIGHSCVFITTFPIAHVFNVLHIAMLQEWSGGWWCHFTRALTQPWMQTGNHVHIEFSTIAATHLQWVNFCVVLLFAAIFTILELYRYNPFHHRSDRRVHMALFQRCAKRPQGLPVGGVAQRHQSQSAGSRRQVTLEKFPRESIFVLATKCSVVSARGCNYLITTRLSRAVD